VISVVIPCYNSQKTVSGVVDGMEKGLSDAGETSWEIVLVDDGTRDGTAEVLATLAGGNPRVHVVTLGRNVGQQMAILAGLRATSGDVVVCCDDDGESPVTEVGRLLEAIREGADVAYARWRTTPLGPGHRLGTGVNSLMARWVIGKPRGLAVTSFWAMRAFVVQNLCAYRGLTPYFLGIVLRSTDRVVNVPLDRGRRLHGRSGYSMGTLLRFFIAGATNYSLLPVRFGVLLGLLLLLTGLGLLVARGVFALVSPCAPSPDLLWAFVLLAGGGVSITLGLVAFYLARLFVLRSGIPQYAVRPPGKES